MTVVLLVTGLFVYGHVRHEVEEEVDQGLAARAMDVAALARQTDLAPAAGRSVRQRERNPAQILDASGNVLDGTVRLARQPLLGRGEIATTVQRRELRLERPSLPGLPGPVRLLAVALTRRDGPRVVVVAASLHDEQEALEALVSVLAVGGPIAALLASLLGYGVAVAALRPVERMRRRAAAVSPHDQSHALPVPESRDEIGRLGETLNQMLERLAEAFRRERMFVADASHELRTPLAILKAELELSRRSTALDPTLKRSLESCAEETDRLIALTEDLLVLSSTEDGKLPLALGELCVADVLRDAGVRFLARTDGCGRTITVVEPETAQRIIGDRSRLGQAIGNLVENALRHGGGTVQLSAVARNGHIDLHVSDEGPGFPEDLLEHAFDRFVRGDSARGRGGTGLGLAIANAIAVAHGGCAGARNRAAQGADVWISLPATTRPQSDDHLGDEWSDLRVGSQHGERRS